VITALLLILGAAAAASAGEGHRQRSSIACAGPTLGPTRVHGIDCLYGAALDVLGRIVVTGEADGALVVARYLTGGRADETFGIRGMVRLPIGKASYGCAVAVLDDMKIVVFGGVSVESGQHEPAFAVLTVRYEPDGKLDPAFGTGGVVIATPPLNGETEWFDSSSAFNCPLFDQM
jgi:hypothetical protein